MATRPRNSGFTLVELLVVIAIIGVLVALLLPAVQSAREAARRTQCQNNLKQMGLAVHGYEDTWKRMPSSLMGGETSCQDDGLGWGLALLPFMEQKALYDQIAIPANTKPCALGDYFRANNKPIPGGETPLKTYRCPTSMLPKVVPPLWALPGGGNLPPQNDIMIGYAINDYKSAGGSCWGDDGVIHKWMEAPGNRRFAEVTDGLSNTLMIGESSYVTGNSTTAPSRVEDWPIWIGGPSTDESVRTNGRTNSPINCQCTATTMVKAINDDCNFSYHSGGAQFVFCDGSVKFISQNIAMTTYCNLHSMRDGFPIGDF
jgi:prepilin-type N-terminal cleavage/methylation domain-containing protein/prepilin-type processing-associated H-X9-DG protein